MLCEEVCFRDQAQREPFQVAVADMEAGDVAGPIQTQFGWHVIKLNDISAMELNRIRQFACSSLDSLQYLERQSTGAGAPGGAHVQ